MIRFHGYVGPTLNGLGDSAQPARDVRIAELDI